MHTSGPFGWVQKDENESSLLYGIMKIKGMEMVKWGWMEFSTQGSSKNHLPKSQIGRKSRGENICYIEFIILLILITIFSILC